MELKELLEHFNNGDTVGEDWEVIELMRFYSREAQKITMEINTKFHEPEELSALSIHGPHMSQTWARTLFTARPTRTPNLTREISMRPQVFDFNIKSGIRFHSSQKVWVYPFFPEYNYLVNGCRPLLEKNWKESSMPPPAVVCQWSILMGTQPALDSVWYRSGNWLSSGNEAKDCDVLLGCWPSPS